jgi:hypothetical protein
VCASLGTIDSAVDGISEGGGMLGWCEIRVAECRHSARNTLFAEQTTPTPLESSSIRQKCTQNLAQARPDDSG